MDHQEDIQERQEAEKQFVLAAYSPDEAWISSNPNRVYRRLDLPTYTTTSDDHDSPSYITTNDICNNTIGIELILTMPEDYLGMKEDVTLDVDATICTSEHRQCTTTTTTSFHNQVTFRKLVLDAIPLLVQTCRQAASECMGQESVFAVLSRADEWIDEEWSQLLQKGMEKWREKQTSTAESKMTRQKHSNTSCSSENNQLENLQTKQVVLGRRLIYSHHIIATSKRKSLIDLSHTYSLGGFVKIGWPGIIIIEGSNDNCIEFLQEIKSWRWQYLVVRGEETENVTMMDADDSIDQALDRQRKFTHSHLEELGEDQMSHLAEMCRNVGLESLFMTSMKIYQNDDCDSHGNERNQLHDDAGESLDSRYGVLIHVDHMNDQRSYQKWIQKSCDQMGCQCIVRFCFANDDETKRPWIVVALWGEKAAVKNLLKKWRSSKVDVDSKGKPCLERMMTIIEQGSIEGTQEVSNLKGIGTKITITDLCSILKDIGGDPFCSAFVAYFSKDDEKPSS